jgi:hypothetical protein
MIWSIWSFSSVQTPFVNILLSTYNPIHIIERRTRQILKDLISAFEDFVFLKLETNLKENVKAKNEHTKMFIKARSFRI